MSLLLLVDSDSLGERVDARTLERPIRAEIDRRRLESSIREAIDCLGSESVESRQQGVRVLARFASGDDGQELIGQVGGIPPLVALLSDADEDVREVVLIALDHLALNDENKRLIMQTQAIPILMMLRISGSMSVRRDAAGVLGRRLIRHPEYPLWSSKLENIVFLVGRLGDVDRVVRRSASMVLWQVAWGSLDARNPVSMIAKAGGVAPLVNLLSDVDREACMMAVGTLKVLAQKPKHQALIVEAGGIPRLVALLGDSDARVRGDAASALGSLALNHSTNKALIDQVRGTPRVVALLRDQEWRVRLAAARALGYFARHELAHRILREQAGEAAPLLVLLRDPGGRAVRQAAVDALANTYFQRLIAQSGGIAPLVALLSDCHGDVRGAAAVALAELSFKNPENQHLIAQSGGIPPLVALLSDRDRDVCGAAATALAELSFKNSENQGLIAQAGAIPRLVAFLCSCRMLMRRNAANILAQRAANREDDQKMIVRPRGMRPLPEPLLDDATIGVIEVRQQQVVNLLKALVHVSLCDDEGMVAALEAQEQEEDHCVIKVDLQYILSHWRKKPGSDVLCEELSAQEVTGPSP